MNDVNPLRRVRNSPDADDGVPAALSASRDGDRLAGLMKRSGRGDEAAFAALYDEIGGRIYGIVLKVVRDHAQSEEVAQEVFLEIWRLAPRFDHTKGSVKSWTSTIAHRRAVDRVRSSQSRRDREDREHATALEPTDALVDAIDERFEQERVLRALDQLTETQREAVSLAYYGGHTYREVAVLLDVPEGTVKTRIRDGLIRLRDHLGVT